MYMDIHSNFQWLLWPFTAETVKTFHVLMLEDNPELHTRIIYHLYFFFFLYIYNK